MDFFIYRGPEIRKDKKLIYNRDRSYTINIKKKEKFKHIIYTQQPKSLN